MLLKKVRRGSIRKRPFLVEEMTFLKSCAQQESNLYLQLRRLTLYPLSYGRGNYFVRFPHSRKSTAQIFYLIIVTFFQNILQRQIILVENINRFHAGSHVAIFTRRRCLPRHILANFIPHTPSFACHTSPLISIHESIC